MAGPSQFSVSLRILTDDNYDARKINILSYAAEFDIKKFLVIKKYR